MILEEYAVWRVVSERIASLYELDTCWSLDELVKINAILDMKRDVEEMQKKELEKKRKK